MDEIIIEEIHAELKCRFLEHLSTCAHPRLTASPCSAYFIILSTGANEESS